MVQFYGYSTDNTFTNKYILTARGDRIVVMVVMVVMVVTVAMAVVVVHPRGWGVGGGG